MLKINTQAAPASKPVTILLDAVRMPLAAMWRRHCYRADLRAMLQGTPHLLTDFGMTPEEAEVEARTAFWQSPHVPSLRHF